MTITPTQDAPGTPLPWLANGQRIETARCRSVGRAHLDSFAGIGKPEATANAAYIVLACNAYPELVAALDKYADDLCEGWCEKSPDCAHFDDCGGCLARRTAWQAKAGVL